MLLFNTPLPSTNTCAPAFKNILCYCSTSFPYASDLRLCLFKNILCYCSTINALRLIHSYPLFKNILCYCSTIKIDVRPYCKKRFKNILCYCSTEYRLGIISYIVYLKTSYVIVQREKLAGNDRGDMI